MSPFVNFADIEQVNRIELKPGEVVVFRTSQPVDSDVVAGWLSYLDDTPLAGRAIFMTGDWEIDTVLPEDD